MHDDGRMPRPLAVLARVPLTTGLVAAILIVGVLTGSLWNPLESRALFGSVTYGLPAIEAGQWWTTVAGAFFAIQPVQYLPILLGLALFGGFAEWRLGTAKAALALASMQLAAVLGSAALLWLIANHGYQWATLLSHQRDAGPSAGFLGAAAAATVTLAARWRGRARAVLAAYAFLSLVHVGGLADLEHVIGVAVGLALGPVLLGRAPRPTVRPLARQDYRLLASAFFVLAAVEGLIQPFTTVDGPLASTLSAEAKVAQLSSRNIIGGLIQAVLWVAGQDPLQGQAPGVALGVRVARPGRVHPDRRPRGDDPRRRAWTAGGSLRPRGQRLRSGRPRLRAPCLR